MKLGRSEFVLLCFVAIGLGAIHHDLQDLLVQVKALVRK